MSKPADDQPRKDGPSAKLRDQACEKQVMELLDEIYELEQFRREQITLRKLCSYLKSALTSLEAHAAIECFGPQLWPEATGAVYVLNASGDHLERSASWGDVALNRQSLSWQDCWAMRRMQPHGMRDTGGGLLCAHITHPSDALPSLCVPLIAQSQLLGVLHLQRLKSVSIAAQNTTHADLGTAPAVVVAEELSLALSNMKLRDSLREQSIRDPLTGLFNRRFVDEYFVQELARAQRAKRQISVVALDIDHFKRINDTYGHSAGDAVLKSVSGILRAHVRDSDVASRVGGEEFLLLLAESPLQFAAMRAEDIRSAIHETSIHFEDKSLGPITASFGAAAYPDHGRTPDALFRAADEALYSAKNSGRNRVVSARAPN
jgi:diguanylate cyclase (GGDEF)-like protein